MHIYVQWARGTPLDWEKVQVDRDRDWFSLPTRPEPAIGVTGTTQALIDGIGLRTVLDVNSPTANDPGWIYDISVAGVQMSGADHYHVDRDGANLRLTRWVDDIEDWPGDFWAQEWTASLPAFDGRAGKLQPRLTVRAWAQDPARAAKWATFDSGAGDFRAPWNVTPWASFSAPGPANRVRHGIWQTDANSAAQVAARSDERGYTRWIAELV